jgi:hypothetical protein
LKELVVLLEEPLITTLLVLKQDMFNAQKEKLKKGKKWFTQSLFMKSTSLIQEVKDFWLYLLEIPEK